MRELWLPIKGYEGKYSISNMGRVRVDSSQIKAQEGTIRIHHLTPRGYHRVTLNKNGRKNTVSIARLVTQAFIINPNNLKQVNHKYGNKDDNKVDNLEWMTQIDNISHSQANGLLARKGKTSKYQGVCYDKSANRLKRWRSEITYKGKRKRFGYFKTEEEARDKYLEFLNTI